MEIAATRIEASNLGPAETVLVFLIKRIEDDLERQAGTRISSQKKDATTKIKSDDELVQMGMEYYQITLDKDGKITVPQGGFRKKGGVLIRDILNSKVPEEAVVRREQHKIDGIKEQIEINNRFITALGRHSDLLKQGINDLWPAVLDTAAAIVEYQNGKLPIKRNTARRLNRALEKMKTAMVSTNEKVMARQVKFAASVMNIAARELGLLNQQLERQLRFLAVKKRLLELILDKRVQRDRKLDKLSSKAVALLQKPFSASRAWQLVREANALKKEYKPDAQTEAGIEAALKKIGKLSGYLAKLGRLISDKENTGRAIADTRKSLRLDIDRVRAGRYEKEAEMIGALKRSATNRMRFILKSLKKANEDIALTAYWGLREALLINYYLEDKARTEENEKEKSYLDEKHAAMLERARQLNTIYTQVISQEKGKPDIIIGEALESDIARYRLLAKRGGEV